METTKPRTTTSTAKTIYRPYACGETAHDLKARRGADGTWEYVYCCRNCRSEIRRSTSC